MDEMLFMFSKNFIYWNGIRLLSAVGNSQFLLSVGDNNKVIPQEIDWLSFHNTEDIPLCKKLNLHSSCIKYCSFFFSIPSITMNAKDFVRCHLPLSIKSWHVFHIIYLYQGGFMPNIRPDLHF